MAQATHSTVTAQQKKHCQVACRITGSHSTALSAVSLCNSAAEGGADRESPVIVGVGWGWIQLHLACGTCVWPPELYGLVGTKHGRRS